MPGFLLSRILQTLGALLVISALAFALLAAAGGDALTALSADPHISEETLRRLHHVYQLDRPLALRYANWLRALLFEGDLGQSFFYQVTVWQVLRPRLLSTIALAATALAMAWSVALLLGALAALRPGSWADRSSEVVILLAASTPRIVLALALLALLAAMPATGETRPALIQFVFAAGVLATPLAAVFLAQVRENLGAALGLDFVRVARSKGLGESAVLFRHALRAALNPLITIFGSSLGGVMSGSVVVETILGWPGLGQLSVTAVRSRDVPLLLGVLLITSTAVLLGNLLADLLLHLHDPRLRAERRRGDRAPS